MRFVPYHHLADEPNVVVDGAPGAATVLTLSHWPATPTPAELAADTSAEIVFRYLEEPHRWPSAEAVSNDHLDQDGVVSVFALVSPDRAVPRRRFLEEVASAGDFGVFSDPDAARVSFALATLADPERSPLGGASFPPSYSERCGGLYEEIVGRLPELMDDPERHRRLWADEEAALVATEREVADGRISLEEVPELDLVVVSVPGGEPSRPRSCVGGRPRSSWHPAAVSNRTPSLRVLAIEGRRYELIYRYESWVRYTSRLPAPRVDLEPLAVALDAEESAGARWCFDGVAAVVPSLRLSSDGESSIPPDRFISLVRSFLASAPPAWDPYRSGSAALSPS